MIGNDNLGLRKANLRSVTVCMPWVCMVVLHKKMQSGSLHDPEGARQPLAPVRALLPPTPFPAGVLVGEIRVSCLPGS